MAKTAQEWNEGDEFVFTESPFPDGPVPLGVFTLGERLGDPKETFQYFDIAYKKGEITVATTWIKEVGDE